MGRRLLEAGPNSTVELELMDEAGVAACCRNGGSRGRRRPCAALLAPGFASVYRPPASQQQTDGTPTRTVMQLSRVQSVNQSMNQSGAQSVAQSRVSGSRAWVGHVSAGGDPLSYNPDSRTEEMLLPPEAPTNE